ncbi:MAG TPA: hypothetical protein VKR60_06975 [Candidatus Sulfotelmatobacter sp.]|nr:hypothetical protein [Candidatus Sulfotelmatobacter sp.]
MAFEIVGRDACRISGDQKAPKQQDAERAGKNLSPRTAAARLHAREVDISPIEQFDQRMEEMVRELSLRIMVPHWREFDRVLEIADRVCDRNQLKKTA